MKKTVLLTLMMVFAACAGSFAGRVGLPKEHITVPAVQGNLLVCVWDQSAGAWMGEFTTYDHSGSLDFQVPEWSKWYWIGLWDVDNEKFVFEKWIGHFITE